MIDATVLYLIATDQSQQQFGKYPELDNHVHNDLDKTHCEPLKQVFTRVVRYDFLKRYVDAGPKRMNQEIIDIVRTEHPVYVLWSTMSYEIREATFREIRNMGTKIIGWFYDDEFRFEEYSKWWAPYLDCCLTTDPESVQKYRDLGGQAMYSPVYSNPDYFKRLDLPRKYDVSFVGTKLADRGSLVNELRAQNIDVQVFGKGWDTGYVPFEEMVNIYNASKINLSFMKAYGTNTRPQMKCKIFDICMCGGFLLCEYIPGIEEFYRIDKEIVCFSDSREAAEKARYYLSHEAEREAMARAGWERAHRDHTMAVRLAGAFREIERTPRPSPVVLEMPEQVRRLPAAYHLGWARARLREGYRDLWQEELSLSLEYDPSSREAWYLHVVGRFPHLFRWWLMRLYAIPRGLGVR